MKFTVLQDIQRKSMYESPAEKLPEKKPIPKNNFTKVAQRK